ncbi:hypothetical protein [Bacillus sp. AK128]
MGGSLRFKVGREHRYMVDATMKLNTSIDRAKKNNLFTFQGGTTLLKNLENHIGNYGYIYYEVTNGIFNDSYGEKK